MVNFSFWCQDSLNSNKETSWLHTGFHDVPVSVVPNSIRGRVNIEKFFNIVYGLGVLLAYTLQSFKNFQVCMLN